MNHQRYTDNESIRCIFASNGNQCNYERAENSLYCPDHTESKSSELKGVKRRIEMYKLKRWHERLNEIKGSDDFKTLVDEVGILRLTLEGVLEQCEDSASLLVNSARVSDLVDKIGKTMVVMHRVEKNSGLLLDKSAAIAMGGRIVEIIAANVKDADVVEKVASAIIETIQNAQPSEEE